MGHFSVVRDYLGLARAQYLDRERLRALQDKKLRRLIRHAYETTPFWRRRMDAAGLKPADIQGVSDLHRLPIVSRADLQAGPLDDISSHAFARGQVHESMTSGTSGRPLTIRKDRDYARLRKSMFLRALRAAGYGPTDRLLLLVGTLRPETPSWLGWRHIPKNAPVEAVVEAVRAFRPTALYGPRTPLRQFARHVRDNAIDLPAVRRIFTTAETAEPASTELIEAALGGRVFDIFGSHELGAVAFECRERQGYHLAEDIAILELVPIAPGLETCRVVATNLELLATPMIRYDTGDLAGPMLGEACACGRTLCRVPRFEGRMIDTVTLTGGRSLSPYVLTEAVEQIEGLERYQIIQDEIGSFVFRAQGPKALEDDKRAEASEAIARAIRAVLGDETRVRIGWEEAVEPESGRKFRVVENRIASASSA